MKGLEGKGIPTMVYYPKPLHLQEVYKDLGYKEGDFPVSEGAERSGGIIPPYSGTLRRSVPPGYYKVKEMQTKR